MCNEYLTIPYFLRRNPLEAIEEMDAEFNVQHALEMENHFITASKAMNCAWRNLKDFPQFAETTKAVAATVLDIDEAAKKMRQWITENTQCKRTP